MESNIYRKKLLNAILFFVKKTKRVNTTKLSKLLYFLDLTHFKQVGYPSIGLQYFAFDRGPVPKHFWLEIKDGNVPDDFRDALALIPRKDELDPSFKEIEFKAKKNPDLSVFTPREKEILDNLAFIFRDAKAREISEVSHLHKQPWDITIKRKGKNAPIDYLLAIDEDSEVNIEDAKESLKEYSELIRNFSLEPTK
jgi:uncharacterized phage-associated protein